MTLADSAGLALAVAAVLAVAARFAGALTTGGAVAGALVGACVSIGFGLPGLAVLGTFFVVGTLATRIGWEKKKARGTAEASEGRRDWKRVVGKGGVAAAIAATAAFNVWEVTEHLGNDLRIAFAGALAAALADTLATELGTLSNGSPRTIPSFRPAPAGTPGAVSALGLFGAALGGALVAYVAGRTLFPREAVEWPTYRGLAIAGLVATIIESAAVGMGLRAPGFVRNLLTTAAGAFLAVPLASGGLVRY